jgi:hypothetical protein
MRTRHVRSTALRSVRYVRLAPEYRGKIPNADGLLIVRFKAGGKRIYAVGRHVPGLFAAAVAQGRSVGRLYNKVVKGRRPSVPMEEN